MNYYKHGIQWEGERKEKNKKKWAAVTNQTILRNTTLAAPCGKKT